MDNILILGSGAREKILGEKISIDSPNSNVYELHVTKFETIKDFCLKKAIQSMRRNCGLFARANPGNLRVRS